MIRSRPRSSDLAAGAALLALLLLRLPAAPSLEASRPWFERSLAIQGLQSVEGSALEARHYLVSIPLAAAQNCAFAVSRLAGDRTPRGAWIRGHERFANAALWAYWILAAAAAAWAAAVSSPARLRAWALFGAGCVPIAIAATSRLDAWLPASALFLISLRARRTALAACGLGAAFSFHPFALIAGVASAAGRARDRIALVAALPIYLALDPSRIIDPVALPGKLVSDLARHGWPGMGAAPPGSTLVALWGPGPISAAALLLSTLAFRKAALARVLLISATLLWIVPGFLGARRPDATGFASAGVFAAAAWGIECAAERARGWRRRTVWIAAFAVLLWIAAGAAQFTLARGERQSSARRVTEQLGSVCDRSARVAADPLLPSLPDTIPSFALPSNAERPAMWDFAYWPGWYGAFTHWALSTRTREAIEAAPESRPFGRELLSALRHHADRLELEGDPTGQPAVEVYHLRPERPWTGQDPETAWGGAVVEKPAAEFLNELGAFLIETGKIAEAVPILRTALRWNEEDPRIWNNLGTAFLGMGEPREGGEVFGEGLKRAPESIELRYGLARAYLDAGVPGRAETELAAVIARRPGFAAAHYDLARAAAQMNHWPIVVGSLEAYLALEANPPNRAQVEEALRAARQRAEAGP